MQRRVRQIVDGLSSWRGYAALAVAVFIARGAFVLSVMPPFEGWDEYQHLAYIQFLIENGRPPVLGSGDRVPRSLYPMLVRYPHCPHAVAQIGPIGALSYDDFWKADTPPRVVADAPPLRIYQAQHASLYYRLMAPVVRAFDAAEGKGTNAVDVIAALRLINLAFGAAAAAVCLWIIGRLLRPGPHRLLAALLVALHPLYLINCTRVANDALALLFGTVAAGLLLVTLRRHWFVGAGLGGLALGLAALAKTVTLGLVPFALMVLALHAWSSRLPFRKALGGYGLLIAGFLLAAGPYFYGNLTRFGLPVPMQEAVLNEDAGVTTADTLAAASRIDWLDEFGRRFLRRSLWTGGWSYLMPPRGLGRAQELIYTLAGVGFLFALRRSRRTSHSLFAQAGDGWRVLILTLCVAAALAYHMVHSAQHMGVISTNIWYAAVSFPFLLCLFVQGAAYGPGRWPAAGLGLGLVGVFAAAELYGVIGQMIPAYTGAPVGRTAWDRLARVHPTWLGPGVGATALAVSAALTVIGTWVWLRSFRTASLSPRGGVTS